MSEISDGYHTFAELYEHRDALFLALVKQVGGWAARLHADGTGYPGYFIVGTNIQGKQVSYHMPDKRWPYVESLGIAVEKAPTWDGHTSDDVVDRLLKFVIGG